MLVVLGADRRGDDLQPAGDGDRRRLRDVRVAAAPAGTSRPARVARPRQRQRAQDQAGDGDHRHLLDPPAAGRSSRPATSASRARSSPRPACCGRRSSTSPSSCRRSASPTSTGSAKTPLRIQPRRSKAGSTAAGHWRPYAVMVRRTMLNTHINHTDGLHRHVAVSCGLQGASGGTTRMSSPRSMSIRSDLQLGTSNHRAHRVRHHPEQAHPEWSWDSSHRNNLGRQDCHQLLDLRPSLCAAADVRLRLTITSWRRATSCRFASTLRAYRERFSACSSWLPNRVRVATLIGG